MSVPPVEPWREDGDDDALVLAVKHAGEALAEWVGGHVQPMDYAQARVVVLAAREWLEAPLKVENEALRERVKTLVAESWALTASLRQANATTRTAQGRAERAEALFRERNQPE